MATQKIGLTKLGLKKNTNLIPFEWNGQIIEIKEYLPIEDKLDLIEKIVNMSLDDNNFANPMRIKINGVLETLFVYTNINFTDKQRENRLSLYDLIISSGLWEAIKKEIKELDFIILVVNEVIAEIYRYKTSVLGVLQAASEDYNNLDLDADKLRQKIGDKENVEFLQNVMDKMS